MEAEDDTRGPPGLAPLELDHERHYVIGFPVHVAITLATDDPDAILNMMPLPSLAGNAGAMGVLLAKAGDGEVAARFEPSPVVSRELHTPMFTLQGSERRRMLVDLSPFLPADLAPGHYTMKVVYASRSDRVESPVVPVELSRPSPEEQRDLERLAPSLEQAGSWGAWTYEPPVGDELEALLTDPGAISTGLRAAPYPLAPLSRDPLRYNRTVRHLTFGPEELHEVDPARLDVLRGVYLPEAHALRAELFAARGDAERFAAEAELIRATHPGLGWWLDAIAAGESEITFTRSLRREARRAPPKAR